MRHFEYVYYKFFRFQQKVGNGYIADWAAGQMLMVLITFLVFDFIMVAGLFVDVSVSPKYAVVCYAIFFLCVYGFFVSKRRHERIVAKFEGEDKYESRRGTVRVAAFVALVVLFHVVGLILFVHPLTG